MKRTDNGTIEATSGQAPAARSTSRHFGLLLRSLTRALQAGIIRGDTLSVL
jgi:hypothetical protein